MFAFSCSSQTKKNNKTQAKMVLDSIISITKTHSIYTNNTDWRTVEKKVYQEFVDSDSITSIIKPVQLLLKEIGDFHGFFTVIDKPYKAQGEKKRAVSYDYSGQIYQDKIIAIYKHSKQKNQINGQLLKDSIAYIEIPMIENYQGDLTKNIEQTKKIRAKICELSKHDPKGYIIDLRMNLGGTALPMLSGLGELFHNLDIGGETKDGKHFSTKWAIKNGNAFLGEKATIPNLPKVSCNCDLAQTDKKIAVLVSRYTSSSGELVASSLKSQKNTRLFGEQTMGWSTVNGWFLIASNVAINPATSYYMSVDKTAHLDGVIPDVLIEENLDYENPTNGQVIQKAINWINE